MQSSFTEDGPSEDFYEELSYTEKVKEALRPGGIHCFSGEGGWDGGKKAHRKLCRLIEKINVVFMQTDLFTIQ